MTRLGFLGAMNRDLVVQHDCAPILRALAPEAGPLLETAVSDDIAQRGSRLLAELGAAEYLGGSAFNAARIVALLNTGKTVDLAFFGIAGTLEGRTPHRSALQSWGVDTHHVSVSSRPPATCLAMVENAGRTLLTAIGANAGIAQWLRENTAHLASSIARCDVLHVTSFLDPATPGLIADLLEQARALNPHLVVSLDPGMAWIGPGGPGLQRLLVQTHMLHLNSEEYALLARRGDILDMLAPQGLIVARTHTGAVLHSAAGVESLPERPLPEGVQVKDATGAGDTFCGAFLWAFCRDRTRPYAAAALAFALAQHKVTIDGPLEPSDPMRENIAPLFRVSGW